MRETWVQSLGWEDPLEKERLPTPVFCPGEFHGLCSPWVAKSWTQLSKFHFHCIDKELYSILCNDLYGKRIFKKEWIYVYEVKVPQSCLTLCNPRFLCPWNFPGQNTGVGSCSLLQGLFLTQGWNPGVLHCRQIPYCLSHQEAPKYWRG